MPKPPGSHDPYKWTLDLPPGSQCSIGWSRNEHVNDEGKSSGGRQNEDRYYTCTYQDNIQIYMVLDGHDGTRACDFVQKHLPFCVLRSDLNRGDIAKALVNSFKSTEREFFIGIDPHITRRLTLVIEIQQKAENSRQASLLCPQQVDEIDHLDNQIKGGTTVVLALIYNSQLYIANVGDSRALLCNYNQYDGGKLIVEQLSMDHNTSNDLELRRLAECGLDPTKLRNTKRLGYQQNTRSIGDYSIKGGYSDVEEISKATREPGTAEPHISRPIDLLNFRGFLILMSDGLYEAYVTWTRRPQYVNDDIAHLVAEEMKKTSDLSVVAQNVVEKVKYLFRTTCRDSRRSGRLDDITLIVRNLGYPMHTHSSPADRANSTPSSISGSGLSMSQEPPRLQPSISFPSPMQHGYPAQYGDRFYYTGVSDPGGYGSTTRAHMPFASSAVGGIPPRAEYAPYPPPQFPTGYSGLQMDPHNRHPRTGFVNAPPHTNQGYNYDGGMGDHPINYQQQSLGGQHQHPHHPLVHTASEPDKHLPPHPASTKRLESSPYPPGTSHPTNVGPEYGSGGQQGVRLRYENIPLNTIKETTDSEVSSSPTKRFDGAPHSTEYENVVLRRTTTASPAHLQPGTPSSESLQSNRHSDSCLADKLHEASLEETKSGVGSSSTPSMENLARPRSAEPSHRTTDDSLSSISALPGLQPPEDEDLLLYGWSKPEDDQSSMSTLKSNLSSSEMPSMGGASQPPSLSTVTGESEHEAKTPVPINGEVRRLGSGTNKEPPASLPDGEEDEDDEEGVLVMDMSDYSEASEAEDGDEIDKESGEIRAYIKNWGKFPLDLSWEEV